MKHGCTHILALLLLLAGIPVVAQVSIKVNADRDKILIGEPLSLTVEAYVPPGAQVGWFPPDSIEHFNVVKRSPVDTVVNDGGKKITQVLTVTSFDSGRWTLPPFEVNVGGKPYYSDSISLDVGFISFDPKEDYHDIKDIIVAQEDATLKYIPWIVAAVALLSLGLIIVLWRKMEKPQAQLVTTGITRLTAYEEATRALTLLREKGNAEGNEKAYYSEMNDILRKYVAGTFGISTFERTNEELIVQLAGLNLPQKPFNTLIQSLRISDFVKFAKYRPSREDNFTNLDTVRSSIDLLNNYSGRAV